MPTEKAEEIYSAVVASGKKHPGYIGDFSRHSFLAYLKQVKRRIYKQAYATRAPHICSNDIVDDEEVCPKAPKRRSSNMAETTVQAHLWQEGKAVLLTRLARDYDIPTHQAREWVRAGKIKAVECPWREEWTANGHRAGGMSEVPVTERVQWSSQCARYVDMKVRKAQTRAKQERKRSVSTG